MSSLRIVGRRSISPLAVIVLALAILWVLVPIAYLVSMSFMDRNEVIAGSYLPARLQWENFQSAIEAGIPQKILNSILVAVGGAILTIVLALPAAWAIARYRTGGKGLGAVVLAPWMLPPIVAVIPLFVLLRFVGLNNTLHGLALVYALVNIPVAIWLLEGFVRRIPKEIEEAARIDGAGDLRTLVRVVAPLVAPGLVAVGIIVAVLNYNEYLLATFIAQRDEVQTLPVALSLFQGDRFAHLGRIAAASVVGVLPVYAVAVLSQRWLVSGLTTGGLK